MLPGFVTWTKTVSFLPVNGSLNVSTFSLYSGLKSGTSRKVKSLVLEKKISNKKNNE